MVRRGNRSLIAHPETMLRDGDYVTIIGKLGGCAGSDEYDKMIL